MTMVQPSQVEDYCNRVLEKLFEIKVKAQSCIESITSYRDKTKPFDSIEFIEMVDDTFQFLAPNVKTKDETDEIDFHKVPTALPEEPKVPEITIDPNPLGLDEHSIERFGLQLAEQELLIKWLDLVGHIPKFNLLYRGTRDTFKAGRFHELCDNKGPTISIIKSKCGKVFGGYTSQAWTSVRGYKKDEKSFLFSLTNKIKYKAKDPS
jgi:TLD